LATVFAANVGACRGVVKAELLRRNTNIAKPLKIKGSRRNIGGVDMAAGGPYDALGRPGLLRRTTAPDGLSGAPPHV